MNALSWTGKKVLVTGAGLFLVGLALSLYAVGRWGAASFAPLDLVTTLRLAIPGFVSLTLGCQVVLASFFPQRAWPETEIGTVLERLFAPAWLPTLRSKGGIIHTHES